MTKKQLIATVYVSLFVAAYLGWWLYLMYTVFGWWLFVGLVVLASVIWALEYALGMKG